MFTSEPSLVQRIERMIADTPIIDSYSRIRTDQPGAPDLASLIGDAWVRTALVSSGMPPEDFDPALPADERVRKAIPHLARIRNTAAGWSLFRIFRDLYDFGDSLLTESNYRDLLDKVASTSQDPQWAGSVLRDRSKIQFVVTGLEHRPIDASSDPDGFFSRLDLGRVLPPEAISPHRGGINLRSYRDALAVVLGGTPETPERLETLVFEWLERTLTGRVRFACLALPTDFRLDRNSEDEVSDLAHRVSTSVLEWHHRERKPIQVLVGYGSLRRPPEDWTLETARVLDRFAGARFDLISGSDVVAQEAANLAGRLPNAYLAAGWGGAFLPSTIERNLELRLQVAPAAKLGGFLSDAAHVEWAYGKLQVVRKALAVTLARLVESRYFEEDEVPPLLRQLLHDTPRDLYGLGKD